MNSKIWALLVISFLVSLSIWIQIRLTSYQTATIRVQIIYTNMNDASLSNDLPERYRFRVGGKGLEIIKFRFSGAQAQYYALDLTKSENPINPDKLKIEIPPNIKLDYIEPAPESQLVMHQKQPEKFFAEIELVFTDSESKDYFYDNNFRLSVEKVEVIGSQSSLNNIMTQPISKSMLSKGKPRVRVVTFADNVVLNPQVIEIVQIDQQLITKVINNITIQSEIETGFYPRGVTVRIRGKSEAIKEVAQSDIVAVLLWNEEDNNQIPVKVSLPDGLELLDFSPQFVSRVSK